MVVCLFVLFDVAVFYIRVIFLACSDRLVMTLIAHTIHLPMVDSGRTQEKLVTTNNG
jgi:hypothetical protein